MIKMTSDMQIPVQLYQDMLEEHGHIFVDQQMLKGASGFYRSRMETYAIMAKDIINTSQATAIGSLAPEKVYDWLVDVAGVSPSTLRSTNTQGFTLAADKLKKAGEQNKSAELFCNVYSKYKSFKTVAGSVNNFANAGKKTEDVGADGEELRLLEFNVTPQQNLRFYYKDHDIIGIPKKVSNSVKAPKGYFLAWGDFASADMVAALNLYIIETEEDRKIADLYPKDGYAIFGHLIANYYGEPFNYKEFLEERDLYKLYGLKTIYGNDYGTSQVERDFIDRAKPYLSTRKRYKQYLKDIEKYYENELPLSLERYFGGTDVLDRNRFNNKLKDVRNKALNTPIQTHTSERIIMMTLAIKAQYDSLGYEFGKDWWVYYVRHDEPILIFSDEMKKDLWVLGNSSSILVDGGIVQYVDWFFGTSYTEVNQDLQEEYVVNCKENEERYSLFEPEDRPIEFRPLKPIYDAGLYVKTIGGITYAGYYLEEENKFMFFGLKTADTRGAGLHIAEEFIKEKVGHRDGTAATIIYNNVNLEDTAYLQSKEDEKVGSVAFYKIGDNPALEKARKYLELNLQVLNDQGKLELPRGYQAPFIGKDDVAEFERLKKF